jgi:hypothetical protein
MRDLYQAKTVRPPFIIEQELESGQKCFYEIWREKNGNICVKRFGSILSGSEFKPKEFIGFAYDFCSKEARFYLFGEYYEPTLIIEGKGNANNCGLSFYCHGIKAINELDECESRASIILKIVRDNKIEYILYSFNERYRSELCNMYFPPQKRFNSTVFSNQKESKYQVLPLGTYYYDIYIPPKGNPYYYDVCEGKGNEDSLKNYYLRIY